MSADVPRNYDREYTKPIQADARVRIGYTRDGSEISRFVVQLEYRLDEEWTEVVRFDHDATGADEMAHDVADEGLHMDVYRDGEKVDTVSITGPIPPPVGFTTAEEHLAEYAERYLTRFKEWHLTDT